MDKAQILALADRVEALTGPDRDVDAEIALAQPDRFFNAGPLYPGDKESAVGIIEGNKRCLPGTSPYQLVPAYTSSISAAMSLHPSEPWLVSMMHETGHAGGWRVELSSLADGAVAISDAGCDAARAFTAASLRAMVGGEDA